MPLGSLTDGSLSLQRMTLDLPVRPVNTFDKNRDIGPAEWRGMERVLLEAVDVFRRQEVQILQQINMGVLARLASWIRLLCPREFATLPQETQMLIGLDVEREIRRDERSQLHTLLAAPLSLGDRNQQLALPQKERARWRQLLDVYVLEKQWSNFVHLAARAKLRAPDLVAPLIADTRIIEGIEDIFQHTQKERVDPRFYWGYAMSAKILFGKTRPLLAPSAEQWKEERKLLESWRTTGEWRFFATQACEMWLMDAESVEFDPVLGPQVQERSRVQPITTPSRLPMTRLFSDSASS